MFFLLKNQFSEEWLSQLYYLDGYFKCHVQRLFQGRRTSCVEILGTDFPGLPFLQESILSIESFQFEECTSEATFFIYSSVFEEKAMAPHSSSLAWRIPWTEEPGGLRSMGSLGVRHDWATSLWLFTFMHWRRKWQRTPVFLPGESQGRGSLVGCHLWGLTESDKTEAT